MDARVTIPDGNVRMELKFEEALSEAVMLSYSEFQPVSRWTIDF